MSQNNNRTAVIETDKGTIKFILHEDLAPITTANFIELAQRNSQASVPFALSSLGYGFLWNNPAIGKVLLARTARNGRSFSLNNSTIGSPSETNPRRSSPTMRR